MFENIYADGTRKQIVHQRADIITCEQIPPDWRNAPMIYLGTIDQEIDAGVFHCFPESALLGVMPQGFFRRWDDQGRIYFAPWTPGDEILKRISVLVISELDVPDPVGVAQEWGKLVDFVIVTHAERGASVYQAGEVCHFPARPAQQVDPTGAGDVFSAAFLIRLYETGDTCASAAFANAAGTFSVEKPGVDGIPNRQQVEDFFANEGKWMLSER